MISYIDNCMSFVILVGRTSFIIDIILLEARGHGVNGCRNACECPHTAPGPYGDSCMVSHTARGLEAPYEY